METTGAKARVEARVAELLAEARAALEAMALPDGSRGKQLARGRGARARESDRHDAAARAHGKVILFGEHAVVYGVPALAVGIDRGAWAEATPRARSADASTCCTCAAGTSP